MLRRREEGDEAMQRAAGEREAGYSPWRIVWVRFTRHRAAVAAGIVIVTLYATALLASFIAPYDPEYRTPFVLAPPQRVRFWTPTGFHLRPVVYGLKEQLDMQTFRRVYIEDPAQEYEIRLFVRGAPHRVLWFETDLHLFGVENGGYVFIAGTDKLGRDLFSRMLYGARVSLSIGLAGVLLSLVLGLFLGGVSGYFGGPVDLVVQRVIEVIRCFPTIPLWMALAAAIPTTWQQELRYLAMTVVLSVIGWTGIAREVRGRLLSLRNEDFILAAKLGGASDWRIIRRHLLPLVTSHIIATVTLSIPRMILSETSLSFLGLGLQPPTISWGVLLQAAQNVHSIALAPWLLLPALCVVVSVLAFNFLGDGLRDAVDPYASGK